MKTEIHITGQIPGNSMLRNYITTAECDERRGMFNSYILTFKSKKAATKALSHAYQLFCQTHPKEKNKTAGFKYLRGHALSWDASRAVIMD